MKKHEITVGGHYTARVSGKFVTVRVDAIRECGGYDNNQQIYDVTNLTTKRRITFRSAAKFRNPVKGPTPASVRHKGDEESDPLAPEICSGIILTSPTRQGGGTVAPSTTQDSSEEGEHRQNPPSCGTGFTTSERPEDAPPVLVDG